MSDKIYKVTYQIDVQLDEAKQKLRGLSNSFAESLKGANFKQFDSQIPTLNHFVQRMGEMQDVMNKPIKLPDMSDAFNMFRNYQTSLSKMVRDTANAMEQLKSGNFEAARGFADKLKKEGFFGKDFRKFVTDKTIADINSAIKETNKAIEKGASEFYSHFNKVEEACKKAGLKYQNDIKDYNKAEQEAYKQRVKGFKDRVVQIDPSILEDPIALDYLKNKTSNKLNSDIYASAKNKIKELKERKETLNRKLLDLGGTANSKAKPEAVNKALDDFAKKTGVIANSFDKANEIKISDIEAREKLAKLHEDINNFKASPIKIILDTNAASSELTKLKEQIQGLHQIANRPKEASTKQSENSQKHLEKVTEPISKDINPKYSLIVDVQTELAKISVFKKPVEAPFILTGIESQKAKLNELKTPVQVDVEVKNVNSNNTQKVIDVTGRITALQQIKATQYIHLTGILDKINRSHKKGSASSTIALTGELNKLITKDKAMRVINLQGRIYQLFIPEKAKETVQLKGSILLDSAAVNETIANIKPKPIQIKVEPIWASGKEETLEKLQNTAGDIEIQISTKNASAKLNALIEKLNKLKEPITVNINDNTTSNSNTSTSTSTNTTAKQNNSNNTKPIDRQKIIKDTLRQLSINAIRQEVKREWKKIHGVESPEQEETPEELREQGYRSAQKNAIKKEGVDRFKQEHPELFSKRETPEELIEQGYRNAQKSAIKKEGANRFKQEHPEFFPKRDTNGKPKPIKSRIRNSYQIWGNTSFGANTPMAVQMFKDMGVMAAVGGVMATIGSSMQQAVQYQNTMATAKAILKNSDQSFNLNNFGNMEKTVRTVGKQTKFTAPEVADATRFMSMAGMNIHEINKSIRPIADIALIGDTDLGETADKLTNIITTYRKAGKMLDTRKIADMLTSTFTHTNTDMMMLAESMQYAGGIANASRLPLNQLFAMLGVMGDSGIQASMAGTTMRMMMQNVINPNKKQKAMWKALGIKTTNADGTTRNLLDILTEIKDKSHKLGYDDKLDQVVSRLFRITSTAGAVALLQNLDKVHKLADLNTNSDGLSSKISEEKQNTVSGKIAKITSAFTELNVQLFEENLQKILGALDSLQEFLNAPETKETLRNGIELIEEMGKTIFGFAKAWMSIFNNTSWFLKPIMVFQMVMTQVKFFFSPFVQLIRTFTNLHDVIKKFKATMAALRGETIANTAVEEVATKVKKADTEATIVQTGVGATGFGRLKALKKEKGWGGVLRFLKHKAGWGTTFSKIKTNAVPILQSIVAKVANLLMLLVNPITLTVAGLLALGGILYKIKKDYDEADLKLKKQLQKDNSAIETTKNKAIIHSRIKGKATALTPHQLDMVMGKSNYKVDPMLAHTRGYSSIFKNNGTRASTYNRAMWSNYIAPYRSYMLDKKALDDLERSTSHKGIEATKHLAVNTIKHFATEAAIINQAISSHTASQTIKEIDAWNDWKDTELKNKNWNRKKESKYQHHINSIRQRFSDYQSNQYFQATNVNDVNNEHAGTLRMSQLAKTKEFRYGLFKYVNDYIDGYKNFSMNAVTQAARSMSHIMLEATDMQGRIAHFTLPTGADGNILWQNLFDQLNMLGFKFKQSVSQKLQWMDAILAQLDANGTLPKGALPEIIHKSGVFQGGKKISAKDYHQSVVNYWNDVLSKDNKLVKRYKNAEGYFNATTNGHHRVWATDKTLAAMHANDLKHSGLIGGKSIVNQKNFTPNNSFNTNIPDKDKKHKGYGSRYKTAARPTQIIFNITNLANFAKTDISHNATDKEIKESIENKISSAVLQLFSTAANAYSGVVNKGDI